MTTIYSVNVLRQQLTFEFGTCQFTSGQITIGNITGSETVLIEFSSGGPVLLNTASAPYVDVTDLKNDFQTQIDGAIGAGIGVVLELGNKLLLFQDIADGYISSATDQVSFSTLAVPQLTKNKALGPQTSFTAFGGSFLSTIFQPVYGYSLDRSNLFEFPPAATEVTLWITMETDTVNTDGYVQTGLYACGFTNGTDGYIIDGYITEIAYPHYLTDGDFDGDLATTGSALFTGLRVAGSVSFLGPSVSTVNALDLTAGGVTKNTIAFPLKIPRGATGMYVFPLQYGQVGANPIYFKPPTLSVVVTAGTT